jgi:hypothetical protein
MLVDLGTHRYLNCQQNLDVYTVPYVKHSINQHKHRNDGALKSFDHMKQPTNTSNGLLLSANHIFNLILQHCHIRHLY